MFLLFQYFHLINNYFSNNEISEWMISYLDEAVLPSCNIWSTQWAFAIIKSGGLSISPTVNLVQNIGFSGDGTTGNHESFELYMNFRANELVKMIHPTKIVHNKEADALEFTFLIKRTDPRLTGVRSSSLTSFFSRFIPIKIKL